jgi:protein-disulfide isomerase
VSAPPARARGRGGQPPAGVERLFAGIQQRGITLGDPDAPATMLEFADLQCPFCAQYAREVLPSVVDRYVRSGRLKIEFNVIAILGPDSELAARSAGATALQGRIWPFAELFHRNQGIENSGYVTDEFLRSILDATPGLDVRRALDARNGSAAANVVERSDRLSRELAVESTPSFYVKEGDQGQPRPLEVEQLTPAALSDALQEALASG